MSKEEVLDRIRGAEARRHQLEEEARRQKERLISGARLEARRLLEEAVASAEAEAARKLASESGKLEQERQRALDEGRRRVEEQRRRSSARLPEAEEHIYREFLRQAGG